MNVSALRALALEARGSIQAVRAELAKSGSGRVVVSGMLAEQLARELAAGAQHGAVVVGDDVQGAAVVVRVIAGEPSAEDDAIVRAADHALVPVVIVQTWPQADWRAPFVLSPFVVECRTGEGFPVSEIAAHITLAAENPPALAVRVPVLAEAAESSVVRLAAARAVLLALARAPGSRAGIALEQARMVARLRALRPSLRARPPCRRRRRGRHDAGRQLRAPERRPRRESHAPEMGRRSCDRGRRNPRARGVLRVLNARL